MKIYVDELPKSCDNCKFRVFIAHYKNGWEHHERHCSIMKDNYDCKCSKDHCPLQSLAEHDKQVRKEVCDEIKLKAVHSYFGYMGKTKKGYYDIYAGILDDIEQGETK